MPEEKQPKRAAARAPGKTAPAGGRTASPAGRSASAAGKTAPVPEKRTDVSAADASAYYVKVSGRFRAAKYLFLALLAVYLVVMLASYGDSITYANLKYLMKDFGTSAEGEPGDFSKLYFEKQQNMNFTLFRGSLAVFGSSRLTVASPGTDSGIDFLLDASAPVVLPSDKYLLYFDLGSKQYGLYTALANVYSGTTEHEITGGAIGRGGTFALITRSSRAKYQLTLWDASLRQLGVYYPTGTDDYIFDAAISDGGDRLVIVTASVGLSSFQTRVLLAVPGENAYHADIALPGEMPLSAAFFPDGHFCVVCDRNVYFFDENAERLAAVPATGLNLSATAKSGIVLVSSSNVVESENDVTLLDTSGKTVASVCLTMRFKDVALSDDGVCYLLGTDSVYRLLPDGTLGAETCSGLALRLLAGKDYVLLCRPTGITTSFADGEKD